VRLPGGRDDLTAVASSDQSVGGSDDLWHGTAITIPEFLQMFADTKAVKFGYALFAVLNILNGADLCGWLTCIQHITL
jgi:hypothetical protein